jgi:CDP-6-deoxy-D-xylo-4-hexulose-3-dehydrase
VSDRAIEAAITTLRSGHHTMGVRVAEFEQAFAAHVGSRHAVMVNSGSSANLLAVEALMRPSDGDPIWEVGDEVLVPALAWSTTVWPLVQLGLVPVFVDVRPDTFAIDWAHAARLVRSRTRGVMLIHVLGCAADLDAAEEFCLAHGLTLVEDCCESFGTTYDSTSVGRFGALGTFSHFFSHQLPTIEGGTIVTDDDAMADDLRSMRSHGWSRQRHDRDIWEAKQITDPRFLFVTTGYNVRPMELQGAIGLTQLTQVDRMLQERRRMVSQMRQLLADSPILTGPAIWPTSPAVADVPWMNFPILVRDGATQSRDAVQAIFESHGIETRPILSGNLLSHPVMARVRCRREGGYPVASMIMRDGFMIGCHSESGEALRAIDRAVSDISLAA